MSKNTWSKDEIELLKKIVPVVPKRNLPKILNKPARTIDDKARRLGLKRKRTHLYIRKPIQDRFINFFIPEPMTGCWLWIGSCNPAGYGWFGIERKTFLAHRASWLIFRSPIPPGMQVLHKCDNPPCVNPDHLFLGKDAENNQDKVNKGRQKIGTKDPNAKLTESDIIDIRIDNRPQSMIAKDYGVHQAIISRIKSGKTWKHVI